MMATKSGGTIDSGSNGSDDGSSGSQGKDRTPQASVFPLLDLPDELLSPIVDHMDAPTLLAFAEAGSRNPRIVKAVVGSKNLCIRIESPRFQMAAHREGTVVDIIRLQPNEKFDKEKRPAANGQTWMNVNLIQAIRWLPTGWLKYATDVAIWFSDDCHYGKTEGFLDELHGRLFGEPEEAGTSAKAKQEESLRKKVKLHLINTDFGSEQPRNIPLTFYTAKTPGPIAELHSKLKLKTLQLRYEFPGNGAEVAAMEQVFDYFSGTKAKTKLVLRNVGGGYDQLAFIHHATNGTERFPKLTAMELHRYPGDIPGQPDWTVLPDFKQLEDLEIHGSHFQEFVLSSRIPAVAMSAMRCLSLSHVKLPDSGFISSTPGLKWLRMERPEENESELSMDDLDKVCDAMRNNQLPNLRTAIFDLSIPEREDNIDHLRSLLRTISENKCPNLERLVWKGVNEMVLDDDDDKDILRIFEGLHAGSMPINLVLEITTIQWMLDTDPTQLHEEIVKLARATNHAGLKQLKFRVNIVLFDEQKWEETEELINAGTSEFRADFRSIAEEAVDRKPFPLLRIACGNRTRLLITERAVAAAAAEEPPASEADEAASQDEEEE